MSELPDNWSSATVEELIEPDRKISYGVLKPGAHIKGGVRLLKSNQINHGVLDLTNDYRISQELSEEYRRTVLQGGELLLNVVGSIGRSAIAPQEVAGANVSRAIAVLPIQKDTVRWVHHYFASPQAQAEMCERKTGIAQPVLNLGQVKQMEVPLPPLPEQRRIVARIEELFSRLDAGVAALRHAKAQLQRYRQSVLAAAVTGQLTQAWREQHPDIEPAEDLLKRILEDRQNNWGGRGKYKQPNPVEISAGAPDAEKPSHWPPVNLDMIVEQPQYGTSKKCTAAVAGSSVLRIPNVINGVVDPTDLKYAKFDSSELQKLSIRENDLLMIRSNGSLSIVGKTALVREPDTKHLYAGYLIRIRPSTPAIDGRFLCLTLASRPVRSQIERKAKSTSGVNNINAKEIQALTLSLPPLVEQNQIVAEVEARTTAIDHLEAELDRQITRSNRLRQAALAAAVSGKFS